MKTRYFIFYIFSFIFSVAPIFSANAQTVTKTSHKKAVKTDVVTTGTLTIRKPDYICISTDGGKDQLTMDASTSPTAARTPSLPPSTRCSRQSSTSRPFPRATT